MKSMPLTWSDWSTLSGITTGTVNDIIYSYLTGLGYAGDVEDMISDWLLNG